MGVERAYLWNDNYVYGILNKLNFRGLHSGYLYYKCTKIGGWGNAPKIPGWIGCFGCASVLLFETQG